MGSSLRYFRSLKFLPFNVIFGFNLIIVVVIAVDYGIFLNTIEVEICINCCAVIALSISIRFTIS